MGVLIPLFRNLEKGNLGIICSGSWLEIREIRDRQGLGEGCEERKQTIKQPGIVCRYLS